MSTSTPRPIRKYGDVTVLLERHKERYRTTWIHHIKQESETITTLDQTHYQVAFAFAAIVDRYRNAYSDLDGNVVPTEIAVDGKPAIASYLRGIQQQSRNEIAKLMDVKDDTVTKYLQRFRKPSEEYI